MMTEELITYQNPKAKISEAIKSIRTNLQFSNVDNNIKTIMITSSVPGEGKSFVSANLAFAFASDNMKVLLIDCDLRRGRQNKIFDIENNKGLSNLLIDNVTYRKSYVKATKYENLYVLPSGVIPPNPSELLGSKKNKNLLEILKLEYDVIILDCPPVNGLPDALVMSSLADTVLIVSAHNITKMEHLKDTKRALTQVNANISGVIFNQVDRKLSREYDRYYE